MDGTAGGQSDPPEPESGLVDVTGMALAELLTTDDTVLANSLRRLVIELEQSQEIIAAHNNVVP